MNDYTEIEHVSGTRLEVVATPDDTAVEMIPPLALVNLARPWWRRRIRFTIWSLLIFVILVTLVLFVAAYLIRSGVVANFFRTSMITSITPTPFPIAEMPFVRPLRASAVDVTTPIRLFDALVERVLVRTCDPYEDYLRKPIMFAATGDEHVAGQPEPARRLYMLPADGSNVCQLETGIRDTHSPYWDRSGDRFYIAGLMTDAHYGLAYLDLWGRMLRPTWRFNTGIYSVDVGPVQSISDITLFKHADRHDPTIAVASENWLRFSPRYHPYEDIDLNMGRIRAPLWSPDGRGIAFFNLMTGDTRAYGLHVRWLDSASTTTLVTDLEGIIPIAWSPGSQFLAYPGDDRRSIIVNMTTGAQTVIDTSAESIYDIEWLSSDVLAFAATANGERGALFTTDLLGNVEQLTPVLIGLDSFAWR
jgi:hypothetical protein